MKFENELRYYKYSWITELDKVALENGLSESEFSIKEGEAQGDEIPDLYITYTPRGYKLKAHFNSNQALMRWEFEYDPSAWSNRGRKHKCGTKGPDFKWVKACFSSWLTLIIPEVKARPIVEPISIKEEIFTAKPSNLFPALQGADEKVITDEEKIRIITGLNIYVNHYHNEVITNNNYSSGVTPEKFEELKNEIEKLKQKIIQEPQLTKSKFRGYLEGFVETAIHGIILDPTQRQQAFLLFVAFIKPIWDGLGLLIEHFSK